MGDGMNLEIIDNNYLYFTYDIECLGEVDDIDEESIALFLKKVFIDFSDIYNIDLVGYFKVDIYVDKKIGAFVEIVKLDDLISYSKKIDTKVNLSVNNFYLKTKDLSRIFLYRPIYVLDDNYYVSTSSVDNIFDLIEFCSVEYKNVDLKEILV